MRYPLKVEFEYDKIGSWSLSNPFTTAFCRTKDSGNIMVVGGVQDIEEYQKSLGPTLVTYRYWHKGSTRGGVQLINTPHYGVRNSERNYENGERVLLQHGIFLYFFSREDCSILGWGTMQKVHTYNKIPHVFPDLLRNLLDGQGKGLVPIHLDK